MSNHLLETPKLGFGLMRLPVMKDDPDTIDYQQVCRMVDMFMEAGQTYYDTAYVYGKDGASEKAAKACVLEGRAAPLPVFMGISGSSGTTPMS